MKPIIQDSLRILTGLTYLSVVVYSLWALRHTRFPFRRVQLKLIGQISSIWTLLYVWRTYVFWGEGVVTNFTHDLSAFIDRFADIGTAATFLVIVWIALKDEQSLWGKDG
jgi:hypothetical protein